MLTKEIYKQNVKLLAYFVEEYSISGEKTAHLLHMVGSNRPYFIDVPEPHKTLHQLENMNEISSRVTSEVITRLYLFLILMNSWKW